MKYRLIALTTALFSLLLFSCESKLAANIKVGDKVPEFKLSSSVYGTVSNKDMKDKVTLICFFATWCPPCQLELAAIQEQVLPALENEQDFLLIVAGREHTDTELAEYNETKGFTFNLYPDPKRTVYAKFAEKSIPRAYLMDKDGTVVDVAVGFDEVHVYETIQKIKNLLQ